MVVRAHGIVVAPPPAWDARIFRRVPDEAERTFPVLHAANFPLPQDRGDYGSGAVERMSSRHVLVVLFEHEPEATATPLFVRQGIPTLHADDFSPRALQR